MTCPIACGTPTTVVATRRHRDLIARPSMPANRSPTCWVSRMYAAQPSAAMRGEQHADGVDLARPRLGQQQHPDEREHRPDEVAPVATAGDGHAERAEELDGHGCAERDALDRREERHGRDAGDDAEQRPARAARARCRRAGRAARGRGRSARPPRAAATPCRRGRSAPNSRVESAAPSCTGQDRDDGQRPGRHTLGHPRIVPGGRPAYSPTRESRTRVTDVSDRDGVCSRSVGAVTRGLDGGGADPRARSAVPG